MTQNDIERADVSAHFARVLITRASQLGVDRQALMQSVSLTPELLANQRTRISPAQLGALLRKIWVELDDELSGFGAAPHRFGGFALMARQMVDSANLREALRYSLRFYNLTSLAFRWRLRDSFEPTLELTLVDPGMDGSHFLEEFLMLLWHRFANWLIGERIPLLRTSFSFSPPAHAAEYQLMFPGPLVFDAPRSSLQFSEDWLRAPVIRSRSDLRRYLQQLPDQWFVKQVFDGSMSEKVLHALNEADAMPGLESLARRWSVSSRTIHRQLEGEGTSFRKLLEQVRRDRAVSMLVSDNCQVKQVAQALHMTEPAFSRAFKQWTGVSPLAYRRARSG